MTRQQLVEAAAVWSAELRVVSAKVQLMRLKGEHEETRGNYDPVLSEQFNAAYLDGRKLLKAVEAMDAYLRTRRDAS